MSDHYGGFRKLRNLLRPHRTIPEVTWSARHAWDLSPFRVLILSTGLVIFGVGDAFIIASQLGNAPWSVLAQGLSLTFDVSIGLMTFAIGLGVLALWIPLKRAVGFGTLLNIVLISLSLDLALRFLPEPTYLLFQFSYVVIGIVLVGLGSALYLTCGLGAGPRDGLMTGLHELTNIRIGRIRLILELVVLSLGFTLGGTVGMGTALFALLIGQSVAIWLGVASRSTSG